MRSRANNFLRRKKKIPNNARELRNKHYTHGDNKNQIKNQLLAFYFVFFLLQNWTVIELWCVVCKCKKMTISYSKSSDCTLKNCMALAIVYLRRLCCWLSAQTIKVTTAERTTEKCRKRNKDKTKERNTKNKWKLLWWFQCSIIIYHLVHKYVIIYILLLLTFKIFEEKKIHAFVCFTLIQHLWLKIPAIISRERNWRNFFHIEDETYV